MAELPEIVKEFGSGFQFVVDMLRDPMPVLGRTLRAPGRRPAH
jgi:hypothetical protein